MMRIRTRPLSTYADGFRLFRRVYVLRIGRARGGGVGLGATLAGGVLVVTAGPWSASIGVGGTFARSVPYREILEWEP